MKNSSLLLSASVILLSGYLIPLGSTCRVEFELNPYHWLPTKQCSGHWEVDLTGKGINTACKCTWPKIDGNLSEIIGSNWYGGLHMFMDSMMESIAREDEEEGSNFLRCPEGEKCCFKVNCIEKSYKANCNSPNSASSTDKEDYTEDGDHEELIIKLKIRKRSTGNTCTKDMCHLG